jgi:hypothetical protein
MAGLQLWISCGFHRFFDVLSIHPNRSLMPLSGHRANVKMTLATTEPYFPIDLKIKTHVGPDQ